MTLGDLLLENRIVFLGSSPETGGQAAITDYLANITIQKLLFLQHENRNQEISQITRSMKGLAKELDIPIIALSQLSRAPEGRGVGDRRPQLSDLRESGCLTADTKVWRADTGAQVPMGELLERGETNVPVWTMDDDLRLTQGVMTKVFPSGIKPVFELRLASGLSVKASANHPFYAFDGWKALGELRVGDRLAVPCAVPGPSPARERIHHVPSPTKPSRGRLDRVASLLDSPELERMAGSGVFWDTIRTIEPLGPQPVFDATVPGTHNFLANGIIAHNSIEQDADVVLFVFREEMYKRDDPSLRGKADIIIAKQRNGPTGDVKLTFLHEFTKFVPYSPVMPGETDPGF